MFRRPNWKLVACQMCVIRWKRHTNVISRGRMKWKFPCKKKEFPPFSSALSWAYQETFHDKSIIEIEFREWMNYILPYYYLTEFHSFQRYIPYRRSQTHWKHFFLLLFLFSHFFQIFLFWFFAWETQIFLSRALLLVKSCDASTFNHIFNPNIAWFQWFHFNYSNCTPFFLRENDGKMNITIRLSRLPTRFWVKIFNFEKKIVKMSTVYAEVSERESI